MKILIDKYPMGSFSGQKSPGRYFDEYLYDNLKILAKRIVDDMTFLGIISSSTLEVGTGKTAFATQIGEAWCQIMKDMHKIDLSMTMNNLVFKPEDLIKRSFDIPRYSFILLDEWEDVHYWSKLGISLRQFFRKCRQLNLFMIVIIPNYFQMPISYAISRSIFFIDVKFFDDFQRGSFSFYNFGAKKDLYLKGKKFYDYNVVKPSFSGSFSKGYGVNEQEYRAAKYKDMMDDSNEKKVLTEKEIMVKVVRKFREKLPQIPLRLLAHGFGLSSRTISRYLNSDLTIEETTVSVDNDKWTQIINNPMDNDVILEEEQING